MVDFPLPYHRAAFKVAIGLQVIGNMQSTVRSKAPNPYDYMDLMFEQQSQIYNYAATVNDTQLVDYIANLVSKNLHVDKAAFVTGMADGNMDWLARVDWKFACSLGVSGTPMPYINRVFLDAGIADYTLTDWQKILDPMLKNDNYLL